MIYNKISATSPAENFHELPYVQSANLIEDACIIINTARSVAQKAVNWTLVQRNWLLGRRIAEEELKGENRAEYGAKTICSLAEKLTEIYGKGFDRSNLYHFLCFYKAFPRIVDTSCRQFAMLLSWSHFRILSDVMDEEARMWYACEAASQAWSFKTLQRNIASQYYYRLLKSPDKKAVEEEMNSKTQDTQAERLEFVKSPVIAEFLGMDVKRQYLETDLESCILDNLQTFLMELGKGFAFVARQKRIVTRLHEYSIDLVFYNYILKCFVLIDLKTSCITHQDVGQMDMYVRMFDEKERGEGDNPTLGIILCSETDEDIMRYSILRDNEQLFASKYLLYMPSEQQLRAEIEHQKALYYLQHGDGKTT